MRAPTVHQRIAALPYLGTTPLPAPSHSIDLDPPGRVLLGVEAFERYMTDEDQQLQDGMGLAGYSVCGRNLPHDHTDVRWIVEDFEAGVLVIPDRREWAGDSAIPQGNIAFTGLDAVAKDSSLFRVGIHKDAHQDPDKYRDFYAAANCHAWIVYYHPEIVCRLAPFIRPEHVIRTWHSVNPEDVPAFASGQGRKFCLLSGAHDPRLYPLRDRLIQESKAGRLPAVDVLPHPAYTLRGRKTPAYLRTLSEYRVAICTASVFGYSLRKIIEATACGCRVITDLPADDPLPLIDENLIRVSPDISTSELLAAASRAAISYDDGRQEHLAARAIEFYDYRRRAREVATSIEWLRSTWGQNESAEGSH
jgi:hypothetical protein